jgi:flagellar hook-basal body complex protein FliE
MIPTTYWFSKKSLIVGLLVALVAMAAPAARAAFTDNFDALEAELQSRSTALSNSLDKVEQKQKKAVDKAIATIDKPATTIAADVKTAGSVAKSLIKTFPSEFATASLVFSNDVSILVSDVFDGLESDVADQLSDLEATVNALGEGKAKTKALAAVADAQDVLDAADSAPDLATRGKALASALKAIASGLKAVNSASGGGGGGGCTSSSLTMTVSNEGTQWIADVPSASFRPDTGDLTIGGIRGTIPFDTVAVGLFPADGQADNVDYALGETSSGGTTAYASGVTSTNGGIVYELVSGTIHIAAINAGPVGAINGTVSGTFHFTAVDGADANNVITIDGTFNICNMVSLPPLPE